MPWDRIGMTAVLGVFPGEDVVRHLIRLVAHWLRGAELSWRILEVDAIVLAKTILGACTFELTFLKTTPDKVLEDCTVPEMG